MEGDESQSCGNSSLRCETRSLAEPKRGGGGAKAASRTAESLEREDAAALGAVPREPFGLGGEPFSLLGFNLWLREWSPRLQESLAELPWGCQDFFAKKLGQLPFERAGLPVSKASDKQAESFGLGGTSSASPRRVEPRLQVKPPPGTQGPRALGRGHHLSYGSLARLEAHHVADQKKLGAGKGNIP